MALLRFKETCTLNTVSPEEAWEWSTLLLVHVPTFVSLVRVMCRVKFTEMHRARGSGTEWWKLTRGGRLLESGAVELPASIGDIRDAGSVPGLGRSPGGKHGNPLQHLCLENFMDRRAWWATVQRVSKSWPQLRQPSMVQGENIRCREQCHQGRWGLLPSQVL